MAFNCRSIIGDRNVIFFSSMLIILSRMNFSLTASLTLTPPQQNVKLNNPVINNPVNRLTPPQQNVKLNNPVINNPVNRLTPPQENVKFNNPVINNPVINNPVINNPVIRHERSYKEEQLEVFLDGMAVNIFHPLHTLYNVHGNPAIKNQKYRRNCLRVKNMLRPIKSSKSFNKASQVFLGTLMKVYSFMDKLKHAQVNCLGFFDVNKRKQIYDSTMQHLQLVITEYRDGLRRYSKKNELQHTKVAEINTNCLPKHMDQTRAFWVDQQFFEKLEKFLRQSRRVLLRKRNRDNNKSAHRNNKNKWTYRLSKL